MGDSESESRYIHGTDSVEQGRLALMNQVMNKRALRELALAGKERVLDLGCGIGLLTRDIARAVGPEGSVVGIERSAEQLAEARRRAQAAGEDRLVDFRMGDAVSPPLEDDEWGSFDLAHARFLLEHLRDPLSAVRAMVRAVRPGGRVILQDDGHDTLRLHPEPAGFSALWESYWRTYEDLGNDPVVGHRLVSLLHQAGAAPTRNDWIFFGGCAGDSVFVPLMENLLGILDGARAAMQGAGRLHAAEFDRVRSALADFAHRPDAAMWYAISWAEGRRAE